MKSKIIVGESLESLENLSADIMDLAFIDAPSPPADKSTYQKLVLENNEYMEWLADCFVEIFRILKPSGYVVVYDTPFNMVFYTTLLNQLGYYREWICLNSNLDRDEFYDKRHQAITIFSKQKSTKKSIYSVIGQDKVPITSDVWNDLNRFAGSSSDYPHYMPTKILAIERILLMLTVKSAAVLVPFLADGSALIASKKLKRNYLAIEEETDIMKETKNILASVKSYKQGDYKISYFDEQTVTAQI